MSAWNDSMHFCDWVGVSCNQSIRRVVGLSLEARKLSGSIPPSLGNLTYLTEIRLGDNNLHGQIPQEFGRLLRLRHLNLSFNNFSGEIPVNISHCTELVVLTIGANRLEGQIPSQFFTLTKLELLGFGVNNLTGTIPPWIGNFSSMLRLSFAKNNFQGDIPNGVGRLHRLKFFTVYGNYFTGSVPLSIYNITSLNYFSVTQNRLQVLVPPNNGFSLPNLQIFYGAINNFNGPIPTFFANASSLQEIDLSENNFTGKIPEDLGNLNDLVLLNFDDNRLGTGKVGDLSFISSLTNCTSLSILGAAGNHFGGVLPPSITNLSDQFTSLTLGENMLSGGLPVGIENLINLQVFAVENNYLNGSVPLNVGKLQNLAKLYLQGNKLSGPIPSSIGNLSLIIELRLNDNELDGSIPPSLGRCKRLQALDLSNNKLSGTIPEEVLSLPSLSLFLALAQNSLTGPLPAQVGELISLSELDLSENMLSGNIPEDLGKCIGLIHLFLDHNLFEGTIPQSLEALKGLEALDLSSNNLSGPIPQFLDQFLALKYLNLSYNSLCGGFQHLHLPSCMPNPTHSSNKFLTKKVLACTISTVTSAIVILSILLVCLMLKKSRKNASNSSSNSKDFLLQVSYLQLSRSTDGFSRDNLIGSGSFGSVYKGSLSNDGLIVAIKVVNLQQEGASKSFVDECKALANIRHRNLLKIITSVSSIDGQGNEFKALVFDFMSNGNLDRWLHPTNQGENQRRLSLIQRLNSAIDIACALDYLHNHCETPIVHCDLKPSNVLLDDDMVAHVGDFGLARFMLEGSNDQSSFSQTMSLALKGSIGYIPPEYATGGRVSSEGDIFSYGILLLEMIIGKRPTDSAFHSGVDIHMFTSMALSHGALAIIDPYLLYEETRCQEEEKEDRIQEIAIMMGEDNHGRETVPRWMEECVVSIMRIGLSCSSTVPRERTSMNMVVDELQKIRSCYLKFKKALGS
ncbi:putative receptor-like protein kinase At3g47110 [Cucurbita pepo subsp. pepo]|uniref:putative receptor-like protein kinase At3g47110 n=1 Tax=Cucurbita pepo subsp. pepo TaxID=3664 RepID=UPI000C9D83C9|nr:putative receptor-like protein kinase At3g47110 [Cucurbita pepo subsp. pepo]XP_023539714.1 putative receptor-like protein kinase At3g47110 [Cucurbita pepo subsp. pepo]XP_023539715.1 putative receptor-like protein kinase At3g47110 [Cucurbita pepo subsp. pepo]